MASAHSGSGWGTIGSTSLGGLLIKTVSLSSAAPMATVGPLCPAADLCLCLASSISGLQGAEGARKQLFAAVCSPSCWPFKPPRKKETDCEVDPGRKDAGLTPVARSGCFQVMESGRSRARSPLNGLPWLSSGGWVASRIWETASGSGLWDSWPLGSSFSQVSRATSPTAVHTQDRLGQGSSPAGSYRESCHVMGSDLSSGPGAETWVLGLLCQVPAMQFLQVILLFLVLLSAKRGWTNERYCSKSYAAMHSNSLSPELPTRAIGHHHPYL